MGRAERLRSDRGASTVLLAFLLPVILGVQALTIDVTRMFVAKRELQNAVDAAAMAAAAYLPSSDAGILTTARETAIAYALLNGVQISEDDVVFSTAVQPNDQILVSASGNVTFAFARTFGLTSGTVTAESMAQVGQLGAKQGVLPLGVVPPVGGFDMGVSYCLTHSLGNKNACPGGIPGDFHAVDVDQAGNSGSIYRDRIVTGSLTTVHVGDVRDVVPGNRNASTQQGFDTRLGGNDDVFSDVVEVIVECGGAASCGYRVLDWNHPRIGVVPIVQYNTTTVTVLGFAVFFLEQNAGSGNVVGRFIDTAVPGGEWAPLSGGTGYGTYLVRLTQ